MNGLGGPRALTRGYVFGAVVLAIVLLSTFAFLSLRPEAGRGGIVPGQPPVYSGPESPPGPNVSVAVSPTATPASPTHVSFRNYSFSFWWIHPNVTLGLLGVPPGGPGVNLTLLPPECPAGRCEAGAPIEWRAGGPQIWGVWWFFDTPRVYVWVADP